MGDYFCCVCRTFTWHSAKFLHVECATSKNLVKDGSWGELLIIDAEDNVVCSECSGKIVGIKEIGHFRICPTCFDQKRHLEMKTLFVPGSFDICK